MTYAELEADANRLAHYLQAAGSGPRRPRRRSTPRTASSTSWPCSRSSRSARSASTSTTATSRASSTTSSTTPTSSRVLHERTYAPLVAACMPKHDKLRVARGHARRARTRRRVRRRRRTAGCCGTTRSAARAPTATSSERSDDDLYIVYTGGTTGFPKGVMWRHEDFWRVLGGGIDFYTGEPLEEYDQSKQATDPRMVTFPLSPLMHGGAQAGLLMHLFAGHLTILEPKFDPVRTWEIIEREGVQLIFMTGDAMARPLIEAYEANGDYECPTLVAVSSSAAIFSRPVKERWMAAFPNTFFTDSIGASETGFQGTGLQEQGQHQQRRPGRRARPEQRGHRRGQPGPRPGHGRRRGRPARPRRQRPARLLQGPREVRQDVPRDRRRALLRARRLRPDRGGRQGHAARPRLQLHQHRRGEGLPRGGRDGDQGPPRRLRRPRGRRARREVRPGGHRRRRSRARARRSSSRTCAASCAPRSPATSCRAR